MTERGLPLADGASACPFVAFEDDRDERASVPDHRHRCYAEIRPAPRALAHQEAYCLSSAFPVCPTFQDWARREAARARDAADAAAASAAAGAAAGAGAAAARDDDVGLVETGEPPPEPPSLAPEPAAAPVDSDRPADTVDSDEFGARRNPPRDWAAPPPWLASAEASGARGDSQAPPFLSHRATEPGQGLAGSAADRLAGGAALEPGSGGAAASSAAAGGAAAAGGLAASSGRRADAHDNRGAADEDEVEQRDHADDPPRRPRRPRAYEQHLGGPDGPDWERPRRYEAYPTIKTRMALPNLPRVAVMAGAIAVAAIALFFLPALLGIGGGGTPTASVRPAASHAASRAPTEPPAPTPILYTIKKGENLSKIATDHGVTLEELMAANPQIKNPNRIAEGQQITIPTPSEAPPDEFGGSAEPSAAP